MLAGYGMRSAAAGENSFCLLIFCENFVALEKLDGQKRNVGPIMDTGNPNFQKLAKPSVSRYVFILKTKNFQSALFKIYVGSDFKDFLFQNFFQGKLICLKIRK